MFLFRNFLILMPLLIFHCRTRLFLAIIQQRSLPGGAPTLRLQVQPMNYTLISHHAFRYYFFNQLIHSVNKNLLLFFCISIKDYFEKNFSLSLVFVLKYIYRHYNFLKLFEHNFSFL